MKKNGFTLIEVVLAMTIMAFLTVMVSQAMRRSAEFKTKVQKNIDQRSMISSAMRIIERDINLAFHYQDVNTEVLKEIDKKKKAGGSTNGNNSNNAANGNNTNAGNNTNVGNNNNSNAGNNTNAGNNANRGNNGAGQGYQNFKIREIKNHTAFKGSKDALHFTNINNITVQPGERVSDQQEVGYFIKNCKSLMNPDVSTKCLWRRTTPYLDDKVDEGGTESVLIEGVTKFELRYFGKEKEDWVDNWDSTTESDDAIKNKFPSAVEVTLTVEQNKKEISAIRVVALRFPNNIDAPSANQQQSAPVDGDGPSETDYSGEN